MRLADLVSYCDDYLRVAEVADLPGAHNGLQVANSGTVTRIAAAVDLCAATIRLAAQARTNFLIVHHRLLWGGVRPVVGPQYDRVSQLVKHDIADHRMDLLPG